MDILRDVDKISGIKVIIGTEYSTIYNNENVHLLAYYKNNKPNRNIINYLRQLREDRVNRAKKMLDKLEYHYGFKLDFDELISLSNGSVGRPLIAALLNKYYAIGKDEAFDKYIGNDSPCYIPSSEQRLDDLIKFLHSNNAICVLAHPIHYKKTSIEEFIKLGIDGIECFYPEHGRRYRKKLVDLSKANNLLITGGSDYHEDKKYNKHGYIGDAYLDDEYLKEIIERLDLE